MKRTRKTVGLAALFSVLLASCEGHRVTLLRESGQPSPGRALSLRADLPAGRLRISRGDPLPLYDLRFSYCRDHYRARCVFTPAEAGSAGSPGGVLTVSAEPLLGSTRSRPGLSEPNLLDLTFPPGAALDLRVAVGEGDVELDLTVLSVHHLTVHGGSDGARVRFEAGNPVELERLRIVAGSGPVRLEGLGWGRVVNLEYAGGAGESIIDWRGPGPEEAAATVSLGTGGMVMRFPDDLGVSVSGEGATRERALAGFRREARGWVSDNWDEAGRHLVLVLNRGSAPVSFAWK